MWKILKVYTQNVCKFGTKNPTLSYQMFYEMGQILTTNCIDFRNLCKKGSTKFSGLIIVAHHTIFLVRRESLKLC